MGILNGEIMGRPLSQAPVHQVSVTSFQTGSRDDLHNSWGNFSQLPVPTIFPVGPMANAWGKPPQRVIATASAVGSIQCVYFLHPFGYMATSPPKLLQNIALSRLDQAIKMARKFTRRKRLPEGAGTRLRSAQ